MASMLDWAMGTVKQFPAIVPVGAWEFTNSAGEQVSMWKRPLIKQWQENPLRTPKAVEQFWTDYMNRWRQVPGIGIVTGQICGGYIVIDLDRKPEQGKDGYEELRHWQQVTGETLPETWTVITGSGGYHFYYKTDRAMRGYSNGQYGIDLRADGSMAVAPPSLHPNGNRYQWEISPGDCECAVADETVYTFIEHYRPSGAEYSQSIRRETGAAMDVWLPPVLPEGGRHAPFIKLIGTLNRYGVSDAHIMELVRAENAEKCVPPLTEEELNKEIFPAIFRWEKGVPSEQWKSEQNYLNQQRQAWDRQREEAYWNRNRQR